jgi:invasion protein IalB
MPELSRTTVVALLAALLATGAAAQDASPAQDTPPAEAAEGEQSAPQSNEEALGLSMGEEESQVGHTYTKDAHAEWEVRCVRTEDGNDPCQLYQLLQDQAGNNVAEISIFPLPPGGQAVAGATVITPLETLLPAQLELRVDSGEVKRYPFRTCSAIGCFSNIGFTADEVVRFRRGATATLTIRPARAPDETVDLTLSLAGFTAGYESVAASNAVLMEQQQQ